MDKVISYLPLYFGLCFACSQRNIGFCTSKDFLHSGRGNKVWRTNGSATDPPNFVCAAGMQNIFAGTGTLVTLATLLGTLSSIWLLLDLNSALHAYLFCVCYCSPQLIHVACLHFCPQKFLGTIVRLNGLLMVYNSVYCVECAHKIYIFLNHRSQQTFQVAMVKFVW